jgi:hypothetical protein
MGPISLPEFKATPLDEIPKKVATLKNSFSEHKTLPIEFRLVQLRKLYWAYVSASSSPYLFPSSMTNRRIVVFQLERQ